MLTKSELKEIKSVIYLTLGEVVEEFFVPKFGAIESRFDQLESRMGGIESRMDGIESDMKNMKSQMVTKDYLDDKLADLRGDLLGVNRKQEHRMDCLIDVLEEDCVLTKDRKRYLNKLKAFKKQPAT